MNACLVDLAQRGGVVVPQALQELKITAPFFISQNDGTLMVPEHVERYPVLTFASGPTNSMRGAALLAGLKEAMVVDIGGTTSDVGMLIHGFPREAAVSVDIGGVRTNFRMPDVLAIGLGGGSLMRDDGARIGPELRRLRADHQGAGVRRRDADHHRHRRCRGPARHRRQVARQAPDQKDDRHRSRSPSTGWRTPPSIA